MALMTEDCLFEGTTPPDGARHADAPQVRAAWEEFFAASGQSQFTAEEVVGLGDRVVVRWRYDWADITGTPGHVRGIDLFRITDGLVAEKLSYVKG